MDNKKYFSISEVENMLGVPSSTIRFWEKQIDKLNPKRSKGNTRQYTFDDVEVIKQIRYLIDECHLSLDGVNAKLNTNHDEVAGTVKVLNRLEKVKKQLNELLFELKDKESFKEEFIIPDSDSESQLDENTKPE